VAHCLFQAQFDIVILETLEPTVIRRMVAFASAIYEEEITVEGVRAIRVSDVGSAWHVLSEHAIPVLADPEGQTLAALKPDVIVDARMAKRNLGTRIADAPVVIGLGPGFEAGVDVHAVIETQRGHDLGRVIWQGKAAPNTGMPGSVGGEDERRVLRAPVTGNWHPLRAIGSLVKAGDLVATVGSTPVEARIDGVVRGLLHDGLVVTPGMKVGDIDPRAVVDHCFTVSDKARAIGGGVLEAILHLGVWPNPQGRPLTIDGSLPRYHGANSLT